MTPSDAILSLMADLKIQLTERDARIAALEAKNAELHAACAELQEEVTQLKAEPA